MSPRKKSSEPAIVEMAHKAVKENPRGAPEVITAAQWEAIAAAPTVPPPVVVPTTPCALEGAPIGAKCVVSRTEDGKAVRLLDSTGVVTLDKTDIFYTLPAGAKVRKAAPDAFEVYRLGVQEAPLFVAPSAREAVRRFLEVVV